MATKPKNVNTNPEHAHGSTVDTAPNTATATPATDRSDDASDPLYGLDEMVVVPSMSVYGVLVEKEAYAATLVVTEIKTAKHALNKPAGMTTEVMSMIFEYTIVFHVTPVIKEDLNRQVENNVWLIIGPVQREHVLVANESREIDTRNTRGEAVLAPCYAAINMTMTPDATAGNRLAPLGKFRSKANWREILYKGIPITVKPSKKQDGGWWLNFTTLATKNAAEQAVHTKIAGDLKREADKATAARGAAQAQAAATANNAVSATGASPATDAELSALLGQ